VTLDRLLKSYRQLGDDERAVVCLIAERLAAGREVYGELDILEDKRTMPREAGEELLDATVYLAVETLKWARKGRRG
jgi:hypothetical protein